METQKLERSDTIVLLSLIYASEFGKQTVQIGGIISTFDFIEHGIIRYEELKGA